LGHRGEGADVGRDQDASARVLQLERQLPLRIEWGEMDDACAGLEGGEERDGVVGRVGEVERNRRARADAQTHQAGSRAFYGRAQLRKTRRAVAVLERGL